MATPTMLTLANSSTLSGAGFEVDVKAGVIRGATIAKAGTITPETGGTWELDVDALGQMADLINAADNGVSVRSAHVSLVTPSVASSASGHMYLIGRCRNARVEGDRLRGDIELGDYADSTPLSPGIRTFLLGVAQSDPEKIGLSPTLRVDTDAAPLVRVTEVRSIDFVERGAATAGGLAAAEKSEDTQTGTSPVRTNKENIKMAEPDTAALQAAQSTGAADERKRVSAIMSLADQNELGSDWSGPLIADTTDVDTARTMALAEVGKRKAAADAEKAIADARLEAVLAERERRTAIVAMSQAENLGQEWVDRHVDGGTSVADAQADLAKEVASKTATIVMSARATVGGDNGLRLVDDMSDAMCLGAGITGFAEVDPLTQIIQMAADPESPSREVPVFREPSTEARKASRMSLIDIGRRTLMQMGCADVLSIPVDSVARLLVGTKKFGDVIPGAAMSLAGSDDLASVLKNTINKSVTSTSLGRTEKYAQYARKRVVVDTRIIEAMQLSEAPAMSRLNEKGEISFRDFSDSGESYRAYRYASGTRLSFETIRLDDRSALKRIPEHLVDRAYTSRERLAFSVLTANAAMADGTALFHADHANLVSTSGSVGAPSVATLDVMARVLAEQVGKHADEDGNKEYLDLELAGIIIPSALTGTASQLVRSTADPAGTHAGVHNPWSERGLAIVSSPQLGASSATKWYAFSNPESGEGLEYALMSGFERPVISTEIEFATGNTKIAIVDAFGIAAIGYRGLACNNGA